MNVPPIRLPRVSLVKLQSDDPGLRRPATDRFGDSMGRYGGVRLLGASAAGEMAEGMIQAMGELVLESIENYFGLREGQLQGLSVVKMQSSSPSSLPNTGEDANPPIVVKWIRSRPEDSGIKITLQLSNGSLAHWESRPEESLLLVGGCLETWTAGVWRSGVRLDGVVGEPPPMAAWVVARNGSPIEPLPGF